MNKKIDYKDFEALVNQLKYYQSLVGHFEYNGNKSSFHDIDPQLAELAFSEIQTFISKYEECDISWIKKEIAQEGKAEDYIYKDPDVNDYCQFIEFMIKNGVSKTQSIHLLMEVINQKYSLHGFFKKMKVAYSNYSEHFTFFHKENDDIVELFYFIRLLIRISKNINIENIADAKKTGTAEIAFDEAVETYKKIVHKFIDKISKEEKSIEEFTKEYKAKTLFNNIFKKRENSLEFITYIQSLNKKDSIKFYSFIENYFLVEETKF
jgi:hypothetical protein